jgi:hypothetical protein
MISISNVKPCLLTIIIQNKLANVSFDYHNANFEPPNNAFTLWLNFLSNAQHGFLQIGFSKVLCHT